MRIQKVDIKKKSPFNLFEPSPFNSKQSVTPMISANSITMILLLRPWLHEFYIGICLPICWVKMKKTYLDTNRAIYVFRTFA